MNVFRVLAVMVALFMPLVAPVQAIACPLCSEAIANSNADNADEDTDNFPAAMNQSIYLMLGVPYMAFGVVGFMIYRGARKNDEYRRGLGENPDNRPAV
ncbi:MAG: hypothetical protein HYX68_25020 [Planctomycetes bacterium]|jgi:hypothetical protein|nr:hypothetical protein [Planctomycetota bacterium]